MRRVFLLSMVVAVVLAVPLAASEQKVEVKVGDRPFLGPADAPVTMYEFLDFQ